MAAIAANAELGVDYSSRYDFIRFNNAGKQPVSPDEATLSGVAKAAMDFCVDKDGDGVVDITEGELCMRGTHHTATARSSCIVSLPALGLLDRTGGRHGLVPCCMTHDTAQQRC
jgi:hypothetical protein